MLAKPWQRACAATPVTLSGAACGDVVLVGLVAEPWFSQSGGKVKESS